MYLRTPLVQRGVLRCHPPRCHRRAPAVTTSAPLSSSGSTDGGSDFACYIEAEFTDTLFAASSPTEAGADSVAQRTNSSFYLVPAAAAAATAAPAGAQRHYRRRRSLHCGSEVSSLPPTHAILNHLNSSLWLQVLIRLHSRGTLSGEDCAGALRYLPALTYRPLMPWLWSPAILSTPAEAAQPSSTSHRSEANRGSEAGNVSGARDSAEDEVDLGTEVRRSVCLPALAMSCRPAAPPAPLATAPLTLYTVTDISTAAPSQWTVIATSVVKSTLANAPPPTVKDLLKVWHDLFFALRYHAVWVSTPEQLRDSAHPQLMRLFECFYADVRRHSQLSSASEACCVAPLLSSEELPLQQRRTDVITEVVVRTLTPPILLRKLRSLYRPHRHSAMLFAELYATCVEEEETFVCLRRLHARSPGDMPAQEAAQPAARTQQRQQLTTTALLMDVDLAASYATLPGRRYSGLSDAGEQWAATLQHLRFLLPRVYLLQECRRAQGAPPTSSGNAAEEAVWQPWRQVASILMNVCVWVSNDNAEAERCGEALRCTVEVLRSMNAESSTPGRGGAHRLRAPPTSQDVGTFISCLVAAARDSMRTKAAQLQYGPTDGLLGVYLLSVAVAAVIPASARSRKSVADCRQTGDAVRILSTDADEDAAELLHRLRLLVHPSKSTPREVWAALRRSPAAGEAARHGLVTVGHHLFNECVMPLVSQPKVFSTAQRLYGRLREWATEVGRPLGLHGEPVSALWKLRWLQQHLTTGGDSGTASTLLGRLTSGRAQAGSDRVAAHDTTTLPSPLWWRCGCGFENESISTGVHHGNAVSVACVACVLRTLTPLSWECPSCHAVANSGECVPYCLRCGETHPLAAKLGIAVKTPNVTGAHTCGVTFCKGCPHLRTVALLQPRGLPKSSLVYTPTPPSLLNPPEATEGVARCCWDCGHACGDAHVAPLSSRYVAPSGHGNDDAALNSLSEDGDSLKVGGTGAVVYVCSDCHAISTGPHSAALPKIPNGAPATGSSTASCSSCGTREPGYYTAAFAWACGCGACNSALHAYCHACSRAAQQPTVTCTHCNHAQSVRGAAAWAGSRGACERCHHPHPRVLAAVTQQRLVRCPACQGHVPSTSVQCPHCACTAVAAVAALLPTEADQPWLCHHCGITHAVRDTAGGQLRTPVHLTDPSSLHLLLPPITRAEDGYCTTCGTRRLPATAWERGRLWGCSECGEPFNSELACRRCAALAPGVPAGQVYAWRCATCDAYHPSWEMQCRAAGCGGRRGAEDVCARFCYSPWTCAECGEVTLSSHAVTCATCGAETPTPLRATPCTYRDACGTTAAATAGAHAKWHRGRVEANSSARAHEERTMPKALAGAEGDVREPSAGTCTALSPSLSHTPSALSSAHAATAPDSRLAEVETFLLQAAAHPSLPLLTEPLDTALMGAVSCKSLRPHRSRDASAPASEPAGDSAKSLTDPTHRDGVRAGGAAGTSTLAVEPWEDAYAATVISF
ncbi:conserved hypothetical protein [Leishmania major strain Friedlin]|uniref:RanBP2-type domain-containing protein n=1 Tax=Leishmania major TaxID=5664 RepID=Q4QJI2_LEIMA|nr:conserved hypothetical protein [Leishmania major strain Friedlin]CAG9568199.1 hypothetical_protein_-_conserved [Leishmania major strain Friedlin]CAJ01937.1 conserved hypothetical protein [Leishmania major strain Friedlin]|eukprot:XP_001687497.1 conserved hypothetical protein [Leishmania major strain Friedlin]